MDNANNAGQGVNPSSNFNNQIDDNDWGDWGSTAQEDTQTIQQDDDWGDWGDWDSTAQEDTQTIQQNNGQTIQQNNGQTIQQNQQFQGQNQGWYDPNGQQFQQGQQQSPNDMSMTQDEFSNLVSRNLPFNLSMKQVSLVIAGVLILLVIIINGLRSINISSKRNAQAVQQQAVTEEQALSEQQEQQSQSQQSENVDLNSVGRAVLVEIPNGTNMNYDSNIFTANGTVAGKTMYVAENQIIYCIKCSVVLANTTMEINYFCTSQVYENVKEGDMIALTYQTVNDSYISINSISK